MLSTGLYPSEMNLPREPDYTTAVHILYDAAVRCRADIDAMENAIRHVRTTVSSQSERLVCQSGAPWTPNRRCNLLETAAYVSMRLTLLRHVSSFEHRNDHGESVPGLTDACGKGGAKCSKEEEVVCHIGSGISVRATFPGAVQPPHVRIVWKLSDSDGHLPQTAASKVQPEGMNDDDDEDAPLWALGGGGKALKRKLGS